MFQTAGGEVDIECEGCPNLGVVDLLVDGVAGAPGFQRVEYISGKTAVLRAVPPGKYRLLIRSSDSAQEPFAMAQVEVQDRPVKVKVSADQTPVVSGRIAMDDGKPLPRGLRVTLFDARLVPIATHLAGADGTFALVGAVPGTYQIVLEGVRGICPKTIRQGERDSRMIVLTDSSITNITVVAGTGTGTVSGNIQQSGRPVYGMLVALVPDDLSKEPDLYQSYATDTDGIFSFPNLRPGTYRLFVVPDLDFEYGNPAVAGPLLKTARLLPVGPGDSFRETLVIP